MGRQEGMKRQMRIADEAGDYKLTVENSYGEEVEINAGELSYGSYDEDFSTEHDSLLDI